MFYQIKLNNDVNNSFVKSLDSIISGIFFNRTTFFMQAMNNLIIQIENNQT
jgi:hypothetical protein